MRNSLRRLPADTSTKKSLETSKANFLSYIGSADAKGDTDLEAAMKDVNLADGTAAAKASQCKSET